MDVNDWVQRYRTEGFNVLPAPTKEKLPKIKWKQYQDTFPDNETVNKWNYENIFIVLGEISNNLIEIDVDVPNVQLQDLFTDIQAAKETLLIAESSEGRKKIYARAKTVLDLPDAKVSNEKIGETKDGKPKYPHVEYRGNQKGSILPPSIHPTGIQYKWLNLKPDGDIITPHEVDTEKLFNSIIKKLREKYNYIPETKEEIKTDKDEKKRKKRPRYCFMASHSNGDSWSGSEGHDFRSAVAWELVLCNYTDEEIYEVFKTHDQSSGEPYDDKITKDQVQRIRKKAKYQWFCKTLQEKCGSIVKKYCEKCSKKQEKDLTIYVTSYSLPNGKYLEEIIHEGKEAFVLFDSLTNTWKIVEDYLFADIPIKPYVFPIETKNSIILPDGIEEYGTLSDLLAEMHSFALEEYDPVDYPELYELTIDLCLASWVSPIWQRNMTEKFIPILNARGPSETGKKRFLTICRWLTYHSLYALKTLRVPTLFRAIAPLDGTLILDEADMSDSSLNNELVEFLNSRCDGVSIPRYSTDAKTTEWWKSFGLTILATRAGFTDDGLESRCVVMPTSTTDSPEKYHLIPPKDWIEKGRRLQRKLLLFKLRHIEGEMPTQLLIPNISSFRVREALLIFQALKEEDPNVLKKVEKLAKSLQERIIKERAASPEGLILNYVYNYLIEDNTHLEQDGIGYIAYQEVRKKNPEREEEDINYYPLTLRKISEGLGESFSASAIAKMWRGFNQDTLSQKKIDNRRHRGLILIKNIKRLDKIFPKYISDYVQPDLFNREFSSQTRFDLDGSKSLQ